VADLIRVELGKQCWRARTWVTLGAMAAVPALLTVVIGTTRPAIPERIGDWGSVVTDTSGFTMPIIALSAMQLFLLPLAVAVFAGESVAGEAAWGTLRYVLTRPVRRTRVLAVKGVVAAGLSVAAVATACVSALLSGLLAFGWSPLTVLDLQHTTAFSYAAATFPPGDALGRTAIGAGMVGAGLASTFAFALLLSTLTSSPFGAVAGGVGLGLVSRALDNVAGLHSLGPWLPLTDGGSTLWTGLFFEPVDLHGLTQQALVQAAYTATFLAAAWLRFARADVLS
jgi:ABC-2 type transport system permease protein